MAVFLGGNKMIKKLRYFTMILSLVALIVVLAMTYFASDNDMLYVLIPAFTVLLAFYIVVEYLAHKQRAKIKKLETVKNQHLEQLNKVHGFGGISVDEKRLEFVVGIDTDSIDSSTDNEFKKATQNIQQILGHECEIRFTYKRNIASLQES